MAHSFNIGAIIKVILGKVFQAKISLVFCTNSNFLYNCFVKLGSSYKKHLIINVMRLRQSYKRYKKQKLNKFMEILTQWIQWLRASCLKLSKYS